MILFSEDYGRFSKELTHREVTRESHLGFETEEVKLQQLWQTGRLSQEILCTDDGRSLQILSPGWWNRGEGPDFKNAQLILDGKLITGDVEIHRRHTDWRTHGHHVDHRYDNVILNVVMGAHPSGEKIRTSKGKRIPNLLLRLYEDSLLEAEPPAEDVEQQDFDEGKTCLCRLSGASLSKSFLNFLDLAGDWRIITKADAFLEETKRRGEDQALYERFMQACGFARYSSEFQQIAFHLPYDRARQLAQQDPLILETAFLQIGGLLPEDITMKEQCWFLKQLQDIKLQSLQGLKSLAINWRKQGVRPTNAPERRLHGAAFFIARTATEGICRSVHRIWIDEIPSRQRRAHFERLFPPAFGFWATHCSWLGKELAKPSAPIGKSKIVSIIGNVFIPFGLADAKKRKDRLAEERVFSLFRELPKEPSNTIYRAMVHRFWKDGSRPRLTFRRQQGLLQIYKDWCERNPSCRKCSVGQFWQEVYHYFTESAHSLTGNVITTEVPLPSTESTSILPP